MHALLPFIRCTVFGHEDQVAAEPDRLFLACANCGRTTPGWTVASSRHAVLSHPDEQAGHEPAPAFWHRTRSWTLGVGAQRLLRMPIIGVSWKSRQGVMRLSVRIRVPGPAVGAEASPRRLVPRRTSAR